MGKRGRTRIRPTGTTRLRYGEAYCELCRQILHAGDLVVWRLVDDAHARKRGKHLQRWTVYCPTCDGVNVRHGRALR